jgi:hypothetical protein
MLALAHEIIFTRGLEARFGLEAKKPSGILVPNMKFPKDIGKN